MAANGGMNLAVGLELSQFDKDFQKLTSKVESIGSQLGKYLDLVPTVNTKAFEASVQKMDKLWKQHVSAWQSQKIELKIGEYGLDKAGNRAIVNTRSFKFDDLFGSIDKAEASVKQLKAILRNPTGFEGNFGQIKEIVQVQEAIIKNWQTSTGEIHKQDAAIKTAIANEQKLRAEQEKRIAVLREQMKAIQGDKSADLQKRLNLAQKISDEMRKWGTNSGNMRAAKNDELVRDLQRQVEQKKKAEKEDERLISFAIKQEELLQKFNSANDKTLVGLQERYNISKRILDIQRQLAGTAFADQGLVNKMSGVASAADARFLRTYNQQLGLANESQAKGDLKEELKLRQRLLNTLQNREIASGASFNETQTTRERIAAIQQEIKARQDAANAQKRANQYAEKEAAILAKIKSLEDYRAKSKTLTKKIDQIHMEQRAVDNLIRKYTDLFELQKKYNVGVGKTNSALASLKNDQIALQNREGEERARIKAINQNNALLNDQEKILGKLWTTASRYLNIFMLWDFGKKIIDTTGYFQQQQVALEGILGSAAKAEQAILRIKNMALNSPKTTYELVGYTKQLAAYDVGNGDPDKLLDTVHELAELSTGLGVDMQRLILAYGQVNAASVLRGQELRQFTEAGIPLVEKLADKFSALNGRLVTTGEVFELISKRQVSFEMVASVLSDMTKEGGKFYEMQSRITDTLYGQKQKLKDLWTINIDKLGKSTGGLLGGIVSLLQSAVRNIRPIVNGILAIGAIKIVPKILARCVALTDVWNAKVRSLGLQWRILTRQLSRANGLIAKFNVLQKAFSTGFGSLMFNAALIAIGALVGAIIKARQKSKEWKSTLDDINTSFAKDTVSLTSGLDKLIGKLQTLNKNSKEYKDTLETLKSNYGEYVNDGIVKSLLQEAQAAESTAISWGKLAEAIKQAVFEKKEYERHETIKNTAIDNIIGDIEGKLENLSNVVRDKNITSYMVDDTGREFATYNEIGNELKQKNAQKALSTAAREYLTLGATEDQLPAIIDKWAKRYGFTPETAAALSGESGSVLKSIKRSSYYDKYAESESYITSALQNVINRAFQDASQKISDNYKVYTGEKDKNYNPFGINAFSNEQYIEALKGLLASSYVPKDFQDKLANDKAYQDALALDNSNAGKTLAIVNALNALIGDLKDVSLKTNLAAISSEFEKIAGTNGVDASRIRTNMSNYALFGGMDLTDKEKDYIKKWEPTDQNVKSNIAEIASEYQSMYDFNKKLGDKEGTFSDTYKENERLMAILDILAKPEYYNQGSWLKKSGSGGTEREFPEWVNIFKDAYELYKKATTEGGMERGVAKVRTDKTVQELYGDFFGKPGAVKEFSFNIGNKTIADIIQENLIKGGLEDGIVDFRAAATAAAKEMIRYGNASKETRGHFIRAGEQLLKWVSDTFADDSVAKWLKELSKAAEELSINFQARKADIDLYRQLIANGTEPMLGMSVPNVTDARDATTPNSTVIRSYIGQMVNDFNSSLRSLANESGIEYTPYQLGDLKSLSGISEALKSLTDPNEMNNKAFTATKEGEIVMKKLTDALKDLDKTVREEMAKVSGKQATGNRLSDTVHNAGINAKNAQMMNEVMQRIAHNLGMPADQMAASARVDAAKGSADDILKAFLESNNYETMFKAFRQPIDFSKIEDQLDKLIAELPEIERMEVQRRYEVMKGEADVFNAKHGDFAPFFAGLDNYRTADSRAQAIWSGYATDAKATQLGSKFNEDENAWSLEGITDPEALAYLNELNRSLDEVGNNGIKLSAIFKKQALDSVKEFASTAKNTLDSMSDVVKNLVASVQAFVKAFNKAYDVMNDGENPKWMQDTEAFLGDFAENFEMLIAPMAAVIALIIAITVAITACEAVAIPLLIVMAAVVAAAAILAAIIAAFQQHDRKLEHSIEDLKEDVEAFDRAITNLQAAAERSVGFEKLRKNIAATGKELEKATAYAEMARLEEEKKNTDESKVKEYKQSYQEAMDSFLNGMREVRDELVSSTEDWANAMGSAIRSAFQNGENAARAFRNTVKTMMGDVIEKMLQMAIIEPLMESILQEWTNSDYLKQKYTKEWTEKDENGNVIKRSSFDKDNYLKEAIELITDPDRANKAYDAMVAVGNMVVDTINELPTFWKDAYMHNLELGTLSGGIESVTEDTARRIEALENSQLGEIFAIRTILEQYLGNSGGFGDSTMASVQAAVVSIASDTSVISRIMQSFENQLNELRTGPSRPLHVTMV